MSEYVAPTFKGEAYHCPHCNAYSHMLWGDLTSNRAKGYPKVISYICATCSHCNKENIWRVTQAVSSSDSARSFLSRSQDGYMIYPDTTIAPAPSDDMPDDIKKDYLEAASIYQKSPRGAVALLRLGLQKLCVHLGGEGKNINADLAKLAEDELVSKKLIRSADIIRIVGNNAVHPGTISDDDFEDVSFKLFALINMIVQQGITEPKEIDNMFWSMPEGPRQAAENRDKPKQK
ncbi:hypothetical protein TUM12151_32040 [Morganella morganii]|uniref:DUF4145 domain-containing protein n=1 Tax=Morganella TaxID=581 RepID=UPI001C7D6751|nr:DUF4145 domain-containing protein [Morganella morganii]ELA7737183.1 DUF4145 domain-containing protein [Morganella morganii]GIZ28614.1 hypothetical protein TUM12149_25840 [Morganella morganii]GIZ32559.1 hypothetical protein TUM12150_30450 [Morganella morganii]GIZ36218.1 hypothetical protein TUM12151_32040 [Morganella morganii]HCR3195400.1 DUF4145 domain-containing protein [Morganella morganii]